MRRILAGSVVALAAASLPAHGQDGAGRPLFDDDAPLALTLEAPFRELRRYAEERVEHAGVLRYRTPAGAALVFDVEVRARGNSRLQLCDFPPLRIDFDNAALEGTIFAGQDHLKLVTACGQRDSYRRYLAQEYQIYEAWHALTQRSFRVRRATIEYVTTDHRRRDAFTEPAFFIEEDWEVAERLGMEVLEVPEVPAASLEPHHSALLGLFHYMIGNTDWSATTASPGDDCCHNGAPIGGGSAIVVLPYDFDHAGLIAADYALPRSHLPIMSVRQRLYRGYCASNAELGPAVQRFNDERATIERIFDSLPELVDARTRRRTLEYVADFYEIVNDAQALRERIVDVCRE